MENEKSKEPVEVEKEEDLYTPTPPPQVPAAIELKEQHEPKGRKHGLHPHPRPKK